MFEPLRGQDGKVYERSAITKWLRSHHRSPLTNEPMGKNLLPAHQVRNMLRSMVASGAIMGDKVDAWHSKMQDEEDVAATTTLAEAGDGEATYKLGMWYEHGSKGLPQDANAAREWFEKSHRAGDVRGTAALGSCYVYGRGVVKDQTLGIMLYTQAGLAGSKHACCECSPSPAPAPGAATWWPRESAACARARAHALTSVWFYGALSTVLSGRAFAHGLYGLPKDVERAREWYTKIDGCAIDDLNDYGKESAAAWLQHTAPQRVAAR